MVSFGAALKAFFVNYFNFSGRSTRAEFWWVMLAQYILQMVFGLLLLGSFIFLPQMGANGFSIFTGSTFVYLIIISIIGLGLFVPTLSLGFRRLHDTNRSGIWLFVPLLATVAVAVVQFIPDPFIVFAAVVAGGLLSFAANIAVFVFYLLPSDPLENKYGSPGDIAKIPTLTAGSGYVYRPPTPPPVFEKPLQEPLQEGRFAANRNPLNPEPESVPQLPSLYHRAGVETTSLTSSPLTSSQSVVDNEVIRLEDADSSPMTSSTGLPDFFPHSDSGNGPETKDEEEEPSSLVYESIEKHPVKEPDEILPVIPLGEYMEVDGDESDELVPPTTSVGTGSTQRGEQGDPEQGETNTGGVPIMEPLPEKTMVQELEVASENPDIETPSTTPTPVETISTHSSVKQTGLNNPVPPPPMFNKKF